jgi:hypothetical protein
MRWRDKDKTEIRCCLKDTIHLIGAKQRVIPSARITLGPLGWMGLDCLESGNNLLDGKLGSSDSEWHFVE